jgi:hypothetical protein
MLDDCHDPLGQKEENLAPLYPQTLRSDQQRSQRWDPREAQAVAER